MAHATHGVRVSRPIGEVFAFLVDSANSPKWRRGLTRLQHVTGSGVGAVYSQSVTDSTGRTLDGDYQITRYDEPTLVEFAARVGSAHLLGSLNLQALGPDTTDVTFSLAVQPAGLHLHGVHRLGRLIEAETASIANLPTAMST